MTRLSEAYPPPGVPVRLYRDGIDMGRYSLVVVGKTTKYYGWIRLGRAGFPVDETRDAWEAV